MCGIAGVFPKNGKDFNKEIVKMTKSLAHRGPDAFGHFSDNHCFLGHRRLSVLDTSDEANQPFYSNCDRYVIVFNGEIYNFKELALKHNLNTHTSSDTEVILELFIKKGPKFVSDLNGMFAIAIYDRQTKSLFISRDRIGIKPIYYTNNDLYFAFASELKALKAMLTNKLKLDKSCIANFLHLGYIPEHQSIYENVRKFPSGCNALIDINKTKIYRYWDPASHFSESTIIDERIAKKTLKDLLASSVRYQMISDVPLGTFLSGGTDSSLVTALAQAESATPIKTFSIGFKENKFNESVYAKNIAKHLKTDHHEYILSESQALESVTEIINMYDEPFADSSSIPTQLISKMAKKEVTVALSGDGGDELFLGYGMYNWANRLSNPLLHSLRKPISYILSQGRNREKRVSKLFDYKDKARLKSHIFSQEQYFFTQSEIEEILVTKTDISLPDNEVTNLVRKLFPDESQAFFDLKNYLKDDLLVKVDRASMAHSLEVRVPLLDHRIIEYSCNIDRSMKTKGNISKYLLKEILYEYVPKNLLDRPKWGFAIPLSNWLKKDLNYLIDKYLSKEVIESYDILSYPSVNQLRKRFENGEDFLFNRIWSLIILNMWLEISGD